MLKSTIHRSLLTLLAATVIITPLSAQIHFRTSKDVLGYIQRFLPNNPTILEAGGHHGEDTEEMKTLWPLATMYVFEPLESSFQKLTKRTAHLKNVHCYHVALSNFEGTSNFYFNPNNDGASSIGHPVDYNQNEFLKDPLTVQCTTLEAWARQQQPKPIDFMWLDMEGEELRALQGSGTLLDSVKVIYTEINFTETRIGVGLYHNLRKFLEQKGFVEIWKSGDCGRNGDALFIKRNLLNRQ